MPEETQAAQAEAKTEVRKVQKTTYQFLKEPGEKDKCPPQAKVILTAIKEANQKDGGASTREDVIKVLSDGRLKTVQTPDRIFNFYKKMLVDEAKYIAEGTREVEEVVPVVEKKESAKKDAKPAAEQTEQTKAPAAAVEAKGDEHKPQGEVKQSGEQGKKQKKTEAVPA